MEGKYLYRNVCSILITFLCTFSFYVVWYDFVEDNNQTGHLLGRGNLIMAFAINCPVTGTKDFSGQVEVDGAGAGVGCRHFDADRAAHGVGLAGEAADQAIVVLVKLEIVLIHAGNGDETLDGIGQLDVHAPAGDGGDDAVKLLTDMKAHILSLFEFGGLPLHFVRASLRRRAALAHVAQDLAVVAHLLLGHATADDVMDDAVDLQVWIAADGGCEVAVVLGCKAEMAKTLRRVAGPGHGPKDHAADEGLRGLSLEAVQSDLQLTGSNLLVLLFDVNSMLPHENEHLLDLVRIRVLVDTVDKGDLFLHELLCHGLIGRQHKIFNHSGRAVGLLKLN